MSLWAPSPVVQASEPPSGGAGNKTGRCTPSLWPSGFCSRPSLKLHMLSQGALSKQQWLEQSSSFISRKWMFTQLWALRPFLYFFSNGKWQQPCVTYLECDVQTFHGAVFHRETCGLVSFLMRFCKHCECPVVVREWTARSEEATERVVISGAINVKESTVF